MATTLRLRRDLRAPTPAPQWPAGITPGVFTDHPLEAHALITRSYAGSWGSIPAFETWWSDLLADAEYDPALNIAAFKPDGAMIAAAQCWTSNFIHDFVVDPARRRQGVARALLLHTFAVFQSRGAPHVDLKVVAENEQALALYRSEGMIDAE